MKFALVLAPVSLAAQEQYIFDHLLEYEFREEKDTPSKKVYYLTNSKKNHYHIHAEKRKEIGDSLYVTLVDYNGKSTSFDVDEKDFLAEDFNLNCKILKNFKNSLKRETKRYHFIADRDTILNDEKYGIYVLKQENPRREKRKKSCRYHYVFKKDTAHQLPVLAHHLAYNEWNEEKNVPAGIPLVIFDTNAHQNDHHIYELKNVTSLKKVLRIVGDCSSQ